MKIRIMLILALLGSAFRAHSQPPSDNESIAAVIDLLFRGMEEGDSARVHSAFTEDATLATVFRKNGGDPVLNRESSIYAFLKAIGTPHPEKLYEDIWNLKIDIDGDFAQAWCDYALYVGKTFHHCGVDAFHLIKTPSGWKIFHVSDTRRKNNCQIPTEVQNRHK